MTVARAEDDRMGRRASPLLLGVAALLLLLIVLVGFAIFLFTRPPPPPGAARLAAPSSVSVPVENASPGRVAAVEGATSPSGAASAPERADGEPVEPPRGSPVRPVAGGAQVVDTGTLRVAGQTVRLRGVRGEGGRHAEQMASYIGDRRVSCEPAVAGLYRCSVDGWDLSAVVLFNGGGRATPDAPSDLKREESKARQARRGVWAGR